MQRDESVYLLDMLLGARDALDLTSGLTFPEFEQSKLHKLAILGAIQNIGEAASRIGADTRALHPEIPWAKIIGMRNRIVHAYFDVRLETVWQVIQVDLPDLITQIEPLVPPEESG